MLNFIQLSKLIRQNSSKNEDNAEMSFQHYEGYVYLAQTFNWQAHYLQYNKEKTLFPRMKGSNENNRFLT